MDLTKKGDIYDLDRFMSSKPRKIRTGSNISQDNSSLMVDREIDNRFEQVFLASPRAKVL